MPTAPRDDELAIWFQSLHELHNSTDRVCAIVWGTIIHDKLKTVLLNRLIVHKKHAKTLIAFDGPLGNFRQSTDLAHAMGLVNDDIWHDLDCVRKIRNIFAHGTSHCDGQGVWRAISFQTEKVFNLAEKMKCPSIVARLNLDAAHVEEVLGELHAGEQSDLGTTPPSTAREKFEWTCDCLQVVLNSLSWRSEKIQRFRLASYPAQWQTIW